MKKKKILIFIGQPPGSNGVQATRYAKLIEPMLNLGWEMHFIGPDPKKNSVHLEPVRYQDRLCHYSNKVPYSRRFSVYRHRSTQPMTLGKLAFGVCQFIALAIEKFSTTNHSKNLILDMRQLAEKVSKELKFDLIAGVSPNFEILRAGYEHSITTALPFCAIYHDPHGARDENSFMPHDEGTQKTILLQSQLAIFMSPLTMERYRNAKLVNEKNSVFVTDSFNLSTRSTETEEFKSREIICSHLGNLATWRPIEALLASWKKIAERGDYELHLHNYGLIYPDAEKMIKADSLLSARFHQHFATTLTDSHRIASESDILVVVIGPRHLDNLPSKFFEYLGHGKPIFVAGPLDNPLKELVENLGVGVYADVSSETDIEKKILSLVENYRHFTNQFDSNKNLVESYASTEIANRWVIALEKAIGE